MLWAQERASRQSRAGAVCDGKGVGFWVFVTWHSSCLRHKWSTPRIIYKPIIIVDFANQIWALMLTKTNTFFYCFCSIHGCWRAARGLGGCVVQHNDLSPQSSHRYIWSAVHVNRPAKQLLTSRVHWNPLRCCNYSYRIWPHLQKWPFTHIYFSMVTAVSICSNYSPQWNTSQGWRYRQLRQRAKQEIFRIVLDIHNNSSSSSLCAYFLYVAGCILPFNKSVHASLLLQCAYFLSHCAYFLSLAQCQIRYDQKKFAGNFWVVQRFFSKYFTMFFYLSQTAVYNLASWTYQR